MAAATCDLCGLPVLGRPVRSPSAEGRAFCCEGCSRVWTVAAEHGIDALTSGPVGGRSQDAAARKAAAAARAGARRTTLRIGGMWCSSCALVLQEALLALPGVLDAEVSYAASIARVTYAPEETDASVLVERVALLGYSAEPGGLAAAPADRGHTGELFVRFFASAVVGMWVMLPTFFVLWPRFATGTFAGLRDIELFTGALALVVLLYGGWPFLKGAWQAARVGRATMDTLVVLGTWTAWGYSFYAALSGGDATYFESASMITTIVLLGRWIESFGRADAAASLAGLAAGAPEEVRLVPEGGGLADAERAPLDEVVPGALVAVRAGERFPADGTVAEGRTVVDQSRLTGEPLPAERGEGDEVWAATVNLAEPVVVRVSRAGSDTLVGRIASLVEDAAFAKSHAERLADAVAGVFVPAVLALAAATLVVTWLTGPGAGEAVRRAVTVLVVACPCALGLATPLAVLNATARAGRTGVLVRGGEVFERAGRIAIVAFDKTGTLTESVLAVAGLLPAALPKTDAAHMLAVAAALEAGGAHPAAAAIAAAAGSDVPRASDVVTRPGLGVEGKVGGVRALVGSARLLALEGIAIGAEALEQALAAESLGRSVVWVAEGGRLLGGTVLADPVRPEAASVVAALHAAGTATAMVSGDAETTCRAVGEALDIGDVRGAILPHDKETVVRELAASGALAFVGDGINDAPALAAADLAVAMGGASEVALLAADVVLLGGDAGGPGLSALPLALRTARRTRRVVLQNLGWAFTYNLAALPLAIAGLLSPIAAAAAMAASSLAVVANSMRLRIR